MGVFDLVSIRKRLGEKGVVSRFMEKEEESRKKKVEIVARREHNWKRQLERKPTIERMDLTCTEG